MSQNVRAIKGAALEGLVVAAAAFLCTWLFRLGLLLPIVWVLGAVAAAVVAAVRRTTPAQWRIKIPVAVASYIVLTVLLFRGLTDQMSSRTFDMTWRSTGSTNQAGEAELRLEFSDYPGNFVEVYGSPLRDHLTERGAIHIAVEFEVVSDLWCVRGFNEVRIDHQNSRQVYWIPSGAGSYGGAPSPWGTHWWCKF